ncbi:MAG: DUF1631 family protein [Leptothrix ochracea]|uniref:DUF1631 family protein n=1 Tax=Leptothrix ochracea TaxID=735331 RepID=UPI0034E2E564
MATAAQSLALAAQARRVYLELLLRELPRVIKAIAEDARKLMTENGSPDQMTKRRNMVMDLMRLAQRWALDFAALVRAAASGKGAPTSMAASMGGQFTLVDNDTIELEILGSRLALAMMDKASWEFADLRQRVANLERRDEFLPQDVFRPQVIARMLVDSWCSAGLTIDHWRTAQAILHEEYASLMHEAYHEVNRWFISQGVGTDVTPRPFNRRTRAGEQPPAPAPSAPPTSPMAGTGWGGMGAATPAASATTNATDPPARYPTPTSLQRGPHSAHGNAFAPTTIASPSMLPGQGHPPGASGAPAGTGHWQGGSMGSNPAKGGQGGHGNDFSDTQAAGGGVHEETRLMTHAGTLLRSMEQAGEVLGRLNKLVAGQVPNFAGSTVAMPHAVSPGLKAAIGQAQHAMQERFAPAADATADATALPTGMVGGGGGGGSGVIGTPELLRELQQRKQELKQAATTPVERATIEIVALMFQSLLTEERIPAQVRVWFARLQMPVLRVAVVEPDFFATVDHPARKLIDRMGSCVMGFEHGSSGLTESLEKEIKRVVQVVEAYPDTGRRVFQTVLTEFEKFLEDYFKSEHAAAHKGVSLAQQIEQRETLAIQFTIEMRKKLNEVPVHDGVREFLFHVWADVLATTAVKSGQGSEDTKRMQRGAADLIWLASAKVSREERSEAIRRLPPLLKLLREGMSSAGVPVPRQDEYIQTLSNSLAAAFSARTATIPSERLEELMMQVQTLEEMLPDIDDIEIDESMVRDISGHESDDLEVVSEGGSLPTPAVLAWSRDLNVGTWFKLDYRGRVEPVQLAWRGMNKQLNLFATSQGRGVMFQLRRLASFLQAGLLVPVEEESLTVRATRDALAKLDADPTRLLH